MNRHSVNEQVRPALEVLESRDVPSTVAADYGDGVWRWDGNAGWAHISTQHPVALRVDDYGNVYGEFADGLWRWDAGVAGWQKLSNLNVGDFQISADGVLYGDFGTDGVWRWSFDGWQKISQHDVNALAVSKSDAFFGDFGTGVAGAWRWTPTSGWLFLSSSRPDVLKTDDAGELFAMYSAPQVLPSQVGLWRWANGWARLSEALPMDFTVAANGATYENRDTGIWYLAPHGFVFNHIQTQAAAQPLFALPNGDVIITYAGVLLYHFNSFHFNPTTGKLTQMSAGPNLSQPDAVGKDGDFFYVYSTFGLVHWKTDLTTESLYGQEVIGVVGSQR